MEVMRVKRKPPCSPVGWMSGRMCIPGSDTLYLGAGCWVNAPEQGMAEESDVLLLCWLLLLES